LKKALYFIVIAFVTLFAIVVFCTTLYRALFVASGDSNIFPPTVQTATASGTSLPTRLSIPKISVDATVEYVALSKSGAVGSPSNFTNVAWYKYSPVPGSIGNAIIDGHRDNALGMPGVFTRLSALQPGDDIYVVDATGKRLHFKVTKKDWQKYTDTDTDEIFEATDTANLILITCSGDWDATARQYTDRLSVFTTLVP
jgi:sortase A